MIEYNINEYTDIEVEGNEPVYLGEAGGEIDKSPSFNTIFSSILLLIIIMLIFSSFIIYLGKKAKKHNDKYTKNKIHQYKTDDSISEKKTIIDYPYTYIDEKEKN
jgi:hypothetical protein